MIDNNEDDPIIIDDDIDLQTRHYRPRQDDDDIIIEREIYVLDEPKTVRRNQVRNSYQINNRNRPNKNTNINNNSSEQEIIDLELEIIESKAFRGKTNRKNETTNQATNSNKTNKRSSNNNTNINRSSFCSAFNNTSLEFGNDNNSGILREDRNLNATIARNNVLSPNKNTNNTNPFSKKNPLTYNSSFNDTIPQKSNSNQLKRFFKNQNINDSSLNENHNNKIVVINEIEIEENIPKAKTKQASSRGSSSSATFSPVSPYSCSLSDDINNQHDVIDINSAVSQITSTELNNNNNLIINSNIEYDLIENSNMSNQIAMETIEELIDQNNTEQSSNLISGEIPINKITENSKSTISISNNDNETSIANKMTTRRVAAALKSSKIAKNTPIPASVSSQVSSIIKTKLTICEYLIHSYFDSNDREYNYENNLKYYLEDQGGSDQESVVFTQVKNYSNTNVLLYVEESFDLINLLIKPGQLTKIKIDDLFTVFNTFLQLYSNIKEADLDDYSRMLNRILKIFPYLYLPPIYDKNTNTSIKNNSKIFTGIWPHFANKIEDVLKMCINDKNPIQSIQNIFISLKLIKIVNILFDAISKNYLIHQPTIVNSILINEMVKIDFQNFCNTNESLFNFTLKKYEKLILNNISQKSKFLDSQYLVQLMQSVEDTLIYLTCFFVDENKTKNKLNQILNTFEKIYFVLRKCDLNDDSNLNILFLTTIIKCDDLKLKLCENVLLANLKETSGDCENSNSILTQKSLQLILKKLLMHIKSGKDKIQTIEYIKICDVYIFNLLKLNQDENLNQNWLLHSMFQCDNVNTIKISMDAFTSSIAKEIDSLNLIDDNEIKILLDRLKETCNNFICL